MSDEKIKAEANFHDSRIINEKEKRLGFAYASVHDVFCFTLQYFTRSDEKILEIGCFDGQQADALKRNSFESYIGVDISPKAIDVCKSRVSDKRMEFFVDDAESLNKISNEAVSYVFGSGVLHHLNLEKFSKALHRVLQKGGVARFVEPAQGPWMLKVFRKMTPSFRTKDEYPFDEASINVLRKYFDVEVYRSAYVRPWIPILFANAEFATNISRWIDKRCAAIKILDNQAWLLKIELRKRI